jgi:hypothetical protein
MEEYRAYGIKRKKNKTALMSGPIAETKLVFGMNGMLTSTRPFRNTSAVFPRQT